MKKLSLVLVLAASLIGVACGSEPSVDSTPTDNGGNGGGDVTPPTGGNGGGGGVGGNVDPQPDGGAGDQDSGTGGGDVDSGTGGGGGGDTDAGTGGGGGDQDGGTTADSGTGGGGGDQDSGTGGGGDVDSGTGGGGDQDSGSGGGTTDGGTTDGGNGGGECTPHSCVLTQGYYKIHTVDYTGPSLTLGGVSYTQQEWIALLNLVPQGDDSVILAKQLIAALLNGGACDPNASATVQAAQDWLAANKDQDGRLPYGTTCVNPSDPGCTAWSLGQTLDQYNSGNSGTPHCN